LEGHQTRNGKARPAPTCRADSKMMAPPVPLLFMNRIDGEAEQSPVALVLSYINTASSSPTRREWAIHHKGTEKSTRSIREWQVGEETKGGRRQQTQLRRRVLQAREITQVCCA
jgi:hypothetical protein